MKKIRYNDTFIYVDDSPLDENETGKINDITEDEYDDSDSILNIDMLENTITDLWGNSDE